ncbi:MAG: tyrosine-type recombinase/integrase [Ilumatobacteraceae bacterium]
MKYKASNRTIRAGDRALEALAVHVEHHGVGDHGVVLADGRPLNSNRMDWRWEQTTRGAGINDVPRLRHHYASALISSGCSIVAVQQALGHSKPSTTLDVYGRGAEHTDRIRSAVDVAWNAGDSLRTDRHVERL